MSKIKLDEGSQVFYQWWGKPSVDSNKPIIILLHEGLGCTAMWREFPEALHKSTDCPVLSYDRLGYGKSSKTKYGFKMDYIRYEAEVLLPQVIGQLCQEKDFILFGHSDGATIALSAASCMVKRPLAVVAEAPHVIIEEATVDGLKHTRSLMETGDTLYKLSKYHGERTPDLVYDWLECWLSGEMKQWQMDDLLSGIDVPVLFIQGDEDHFGSIAQYEHMIGLMKTKPDLYWIEKCGHIPHMQYKAEVMNRFICFFEEILARSRAE